MGGDEKNDCEAGVAEYVVVLVLNRIMNRKELARVQARPTRKSSIIAGKGKHGPSSERDPSHTHGVGA